jgi:flagellar hook assembly protein FlgD
LDAVVKVDVVDVAGRLVATVVDRELEGGVHRLLWDGRSNDGEKSPAGIYLCRLRISGRQEVRKFAHVAWPGK